MLADHNSHSPPVMLPVMPRHRTSSSTLNSQGMIPTGQPWQLCVMGLWACLLLIHQRNSVWIVNGEGRCVEEGINVWGGIGVQSCQERRGVGGDGKEVSLAVSQIAPFLP